MRQQYLVYYKDNFELDARSVTAHRVEGWSEDYAFFGHPTFLDEVTLLIPRSQVDRVELAYDKFGNEVCNCGPQAACDICTD